MQRYITVLAAALATASATQYGGGSYGGGGYQQQQNSYQPPMEQQNSYQAPPMEQNSYQAPPMEAPPMEAPPMEQQNSYQPPAKSYMDNWWGMQQSQNWDQNGAVIISYNNGGDENKWMQVSEQQNMYPQNSNPEVHQVTVGVGLTYSPNTIQAKPGDMIQFNFWAKNHTVTQSTFDKPCVKMDMGVDSGFMPNDANVTDPAPAMKVQVMNEMPMWFYCRQKTPKVHCGSGMVFSVNPTPEKSQDMFSQSAMKQNGTGEAPPPPPSNVAAPESNVVDGMGSMENGQCKCQCLCGTNQYAPQYGVGQWGGLPGMMPMSPAPPAEAKPAEGGAPPAPPAAPAPAGGYKA